MITILLPVLSLVLGIAVGYRLTHVRTERADAATFEEAWDNGFQHGMRTAHQTVAGYPKPWITLSEERGWDLARDQLVQALADELGDELGPQTHPNVTSETQIQASWNGVSGGTK